MAKKKTAIIFREKERTTAEAIAIVFAGVGALWSILAPKILRAKHELEGKALVGPSAVPSRSGSGEGGTGGRGVGLGSSSSDFLHPGRAGDTTSGVSLTSGPRNSGGERGARQVSHKVSLFDEISGVIGKSLAVISPDVRPDLEGSPPSTHAQQVDMAAATSASASSTRRQQQHQQRLQVQGRSSSAFTLPGGSLSAKSAPGGGNFATTGGSGGGGRDKTLIVPDPSGFWTPPRRIRRSRSTTECRTRSVDTMAQSAAAAGASASAAEGQRYHTTGSGEKRAAKGRENGGGGGERRSASASVPGRSGEKRQGSGGSAGAGAGGAKPPLSGASGSSRASRASSRGRSNSRPRSSKASRNVKAVSSAGSGGGDSNRSSRDSWALDPIILAINGHGWAFTPSHDKNEGTYRSGEGGEKPAW